MGWEAIARRQHGVISRQQLLAAGTSAAAVGRLCNSGHLLQCARGVYLVAAAPRTYFSSLWVAVIATDGVLGFATAAHLWGMLDRPGSQIQVIVDVDPGRRKIPGVRAHRVQLLRQDRDVRFGLPITAKVASALDYVSRLPSPGALTFADRALQQRWFARGDIEFRLEHQRGREGNQRLREILDVTADNAAARSERMLHQLLIGAGISGWQANLDVELPSGFSYTVDVAWRTLKLAVEIDGMAHHIGVDRFQSDRTRQNRLVGDGWMILRFTWADLTQRPDYVIATIRRAIVARSAR